MAGNGGKVESEDRAPEEFVTCREDLLAVAIDLFAERGFKGTSMRNVADALGVSVSNIYHYFGSKEGLWLAILEHSVKDLPRRLAAAANEGGDDPIQRFRALLTEHLKLSIRHLKESQIFFIDQSMLSPEGMRVNRKIQKAVLDIYVREIGALNSSAQSKNDIKILAFNVLGLINWHLRWYREGGPLPADMVRQRIIDFAMQGVLCSPDPAWSGQ